MGGGGRPPRVSASGGLGAGLRICMPNRFPGDTEAALVHTLEPLPRGAGSRPVPMKLSPNLLHLLIDAVETSRGGRG